MDRLLIDYIYVLRKFFIGCGGIMYVIDEMYFNISFYNYDIGLLCMWLIIVCDL